MSLERSTLTAEARAMMIADPESCRYITLDMENRELFALAVKTDLRKGGRTGMRLFAEMARYVGTQVHIAQALFLELGVRDKSEIAKALELARSSGNMTLEEARESAKALLRMVHSQRPEWRDADVRDLGSFAEVIEAPNGNGAHP